MALTLPFLTGPFRAPSTPSRPQQPLAPTRGPLQRALDAFTETRHRQAEREYARLLERQGGKFNDDLEREVERRIAGRRWI